MVIFIIVPFVLLLILLGGVEYYSRQIIYPKIYQHEATIKYELENNTYSENLFEPFQIEKVDIPSAMGYHLKGELILQEKGHDFVLLCHGITSNYSGMKKYCKIFLDAGYSVLLYDHRNHGFSDKNFTSMGYFEKKDASVCADYLINRFEVDTLGIMGESMGAATAMQLVTEDHRFKFCIEDCGYSNAFDLFTLRARKDHNYLVSLLTYPTHLYLKLRYKWHFKDISVIEYINDAECPILFIHGESDDYVPTYMVHDLYKAYHGPKMLYTVKEAKHAMSLRTNPIMYQKKVNEFLDEHVKKRT